MKEKFLRRLIFVILLSSIHLLKIQILNAQGNISPLDINRSRGISYSDCFYRLAIQVSIAHPEFIKRNPNWFKDDPDAGKWRGWLGGWFSTRELSYLTPSYIALMEDIGDSLEFSLMGEKNDLLKLLVREQSKEEYAKSCRNWQDVIYDSNGILQSRLKNLRCFTVTHILSEPEQILSYCFTYSSLSLPSPLQQIVTTMINEGIDRIVSIGRLYSQPQKQDSNLKRIKNSLEGAQQYQEHCKARVPELEALIALEKDEKKKVRMEEELQILKSSCPFAKENIEISQQMLATTQAYYDKIGYFTEAERAQMRGYIEYQETRCARMPFEEAKKDFECRSIQIRDYLRYGPKGAPPEEMQKRASRTLAPEPPKLPWETPSK